MPTTVATILPTPQIHTILVDCLKASKPRIGPLDRRCHAKGPRELRRPQDGRGHMWRGHEKRRHHDQAGARCEQQCQAVDPFDPGEIRVAVGGDVTG